MLGCLKKELLVVGLTLLWGGDGVGDPNFVLDISSSWVERSLHVEFQLLRKLLWYSPGGCPAGWPDAGYFKIKAHSAHLSWIWG